MSGKLIGSFIVLVSLVFGAVLYWTQEYAYYTPVSTDGAVVTLMNVATGAPEPMAMSGFQGTDSDSSPIRFRACFQAQQSLATLTETFEVYDHPTPLNGPRWFDCYDAAQIGNALEHGQAVAFLSQKNIYDGVDRVVAVFPDGRAFAWNQLNDTYQD